MPTTITAARPSRDPRPNLARTTGSARFTDVWNGRHAALGAVADHDARILRAPSPAGRRVTAPALPGRARVGVLGAVLVAG